MAELISEAWKTFLASSSEWKLLRRQREAEQKARAPYVSTTSPHSLMAEASFTSHQAELKLNPLRLLLLLIHISGSYILPSCCEGIVRSQR